MGGNAPAELMLGCSTGHQKQASGNWVLSKHTTFWCDSVNGRQCISVLIYLYKHALLIANLPAADPWLQSTYRNYFLSLVSSLMSHMPASPCWSTAVLLPCVTWGSTPDDFTWTSLELISRSIRTLRQWMDEWEMKASIMADGSARRSITLSSAPPHTLTLAQMRAHRSKQQRTHASDLYVVNNRMRVTFS